MYVNTFGQDVGSVYKSSSRFDWNGIFNEMLFNTLGYQCMVNTGLKSYGDTLFFGDTILITFGGVYG